MDLRAALADQSVSFSAWTTATGAAVTVTSATAGLSLWYRRGVAGAKTAISVSDLATLETAHTDGGILVIEGAEHRLDLPDAATAAGVLTVEWGGTATGITIVGGVANILGQANTSTDVTHVDGTDQTPGDIVAILTAIAGVGWTDETLVSLQAAVDAIDPLDGTETQAAAAAAIAEAAGTGPIAVTITIDDGTTAVPNAEVTVYDAGVPSGWGETDENGEIELNLAAGTYQVVIYHAGYTSTPQTLTVPDDGDPTYSIAAFGQPTPSTPPFVTGVYTAYFEGNPQAAQTIELQLHTLPAGDVGGAYDRDYSEMTGVDGTATFLGLIEGAVYLGRRNAGPWRRVTVPADDDEDGIVDLTSIFGP